LKDIKNIYLGKWKDLLNEEGVMCNVELAPYGRSDFKIIPCEIHMEYIFLPHSFVPNTITPSL
jgi:hypothetical protein